MSRSVKPTLIFLSVVSLPLIIFAGFYLHSINELSIINILLAALLVPIGLALLILANKSEGEIQSYMAEDKETMKKESKKGQKNKA